nr:outer dense fiber protein 3B [Anser cygnoides]
MSTSAWVGTWRPHRPRGPIAALYSSPGPKYGLPTNVGYRLHDPSRHRAPAYSFGARTAQHGDDRSPGPAYLLPPRTTSKGKDGIPAYSIYGRPRDLEPFRTPGPGCYSPEKAGKWAFPSAPVYSLRSRTKEFASDQTPGTRDGRAGGAPGGGQQRGITTPLCPQTPGPCNYRVVDANVYKSRAPQYSMLARNAPPGDSTVKPGPGAYSPSTGRPQGLTFGIRHSDYLAPLIVDVPD